jgi:hypothetical protein
MQPLFGADALDLQSCRKCTGTDQHCGVHLGRAANLPLHSVGGIVRHGQLELSQFWPALQPSVLTSNVVLIV